MMNVSMVQVEQTYYGRLKAAEQTLVDLGYTHQVGNAAWTPPEASRAPHLQNASLEEQFRRVMVALGFPSAQYLSSGDVLTAAVAAMKVWAEGDPRNPRVGPFARAETAIAQAVAENLGMAEPVDHRSSDDDDGPLTLNRVRRLIREELKVYVRWEKVHECPATLTVSLSLTGEKPFNEDEVEI
jgi:hypothetical protein